MDTNIFSTQQVSHNPVSQNFYLHSHYIPSLHDNMEVVSTKNLIYTDAGISCDSFNIIYITNGFEVTFDELRQAINHYESKDFKYCLWTDQENLTDNLGQQLRKLQVYEVGNEPGMMYSLPGQNGINQSAENIRKVVNDEMVTSFATILASAWNPPDQDVIQYYQTVAKTMIQNPLDISYFLYYLNNKPVAVMEIFPSDTHTAGIYNLVTLAAYRGAGIGTEMMKFALNYLTEKSFTKVILQASEAGLSIYKKLGFEEVSRYFEFQSR